MQNTFGTRLKELRKSKGLTQQQLAEKLNIHERTVSKWERDVCEPDFGFYGFIARTLGISLEELWGLQPPQEKLDGSFDMINIGSVISLERKRLGKSQEELAAKLNVSANTVSKWERGLVCPDKDTFLKLSAYLQIQPSKLYFAVVNIAVPTAVEKRKTHKRLIALLSCISAIFIASCILLFYFLYIKPNNDGAEGEPPSTPICEHNYETELILPTCTQQGFTNYVCTKCGDSYKADFTAKLKHTEGDWVIDRNPTCAQEGSKYTECVVCRIRLKEEPIEKIEHSYISKVIEPTCTAQGYTQYTCSTCGDSYMFDFTAKLKHTEGDWIIDRNPTCAQEGSKHMECVVCSAKLKEESIEKIAHSYVEEIVPPNGNEDGYIQYTCTVCGTTYRGETISPDEAELRYVFDYNSKTCEVVGFGENIGAKVEIPSTINGCRVVGIKQRAFEDCITLEEIIIPDTVKNIDMYAFYRCAMLKVIIIPDSVINIGIEAFCGCRALKRAVLPSSIKFIKQGLFSDCVNLQTVNIPQNVASLGDMAFNNCHKLNDVVLPEKLGYLGEYAFNNCNGLTKIIIPKNVIRIGGYAFSGCSAVTEIMFDNCDGWFADETTIDSVDLMNSANAVKYLTEIYCDKIWLKEHN